VSEVTVEVKGLEELKQRLEALGDGKLARSMLRSGARKGAQVLAEGQRETVPVEHGYLRDTIGVQVKGTRSDVLNVLVGPDKKLNFIGRFLEFGTKKMAGNHWMQKAFDSTVNDALDVFVREVRRRLDVKVYRDLQRQIEEGLNISDSEFDQK
jgi:HK97 gp10 family phage protein